MIVVIVRVHQVEQHCMVALLAKIQHPSLGCALMEQATSGKGNFYISGWLSPCLALLQENLEGHCQEELLTVGGNDFASVSTSQHVMAQMTMRFCETRHCPLHIVSH